MQMNPADRLDPVSHATGTVWARINRKRVVLLVVLALAAVLAARLVSPRPAVAPAAAGAAAPAASALVQTAPLRQLALSERLTAFGEVATGQVVAISFPRAGQVSRLLVLPGQRVPRGAPLLTLVSDPTAKLAYAQALSAVGFAQGEVRRIEELLSLQLATQSQLDAARRTLLDAQANLEAQRQLGGDIGSATVASPFDGIVTTVAVAQGDRIQPGAVILQLGHTDQLRIQLGIEPADAGLVRVGLPVSLSPVDDSTRSVSTSIAEMRAVVDSATQLIDAVAVTPAAAASFLVPGMHVRATVTVAAHPSWAVPRTAVLSDSSGAYLFQISGGKAHRVNVSQGVESGGMISVAGPVDPRLPVVSLGNYELQDGMVVRETVR
jgi:membrane fusion protein (multidrug efflux system)